MTETVALEEDQKYPHPSPSLEDERSNSIQRSESYLQQARSAQEVEVVRWKEDPEKITESGINPYAACLWLRIVSPLRDIKIYRQGLLCLLRLSPFGLSALSRSLLSLMKKKKKKSDERRALVPLSRCLIAAWQELSLLEPFSSGLTIQTCKLKWAAWKLNQKLDDLVCGSEAQFVRAFGAQAAVPEGR